MWRRSTQNWPLLAKGISRGNKISGDVKKFYLQPLLDGCTCIPDTEYEIAKTGSKTVVWGLLHHRFIYHRHRLGKLSSTKQQPVPVERAKEVGVRKVTGATQGQLIRQFLTESFLVNLMALGLALILVGLFQSF